MSVSDPSRIWWDTSQPGASDVNLTDAEPSAGAPASDDEHTGTESLSKGTMVKCARSGFDVPFSETVIDPVSGNRVWKRFADKVPEADEGSHPPTSTPTRFGDA